MRIATGQGLTRQILHYAWPVLVAQILSMAMMTADTMITGYSSTEDMAALAVGSGIYISVIMLLVGVIQAVAPTASHHVGEGNDAAVWGTLQQGLWLAFFLAIPGTFLLLFPEGLLKATTMSPEVGALTRRYLAVVALAVLPVLFYRTFYAFSNAIGRPRVLMLINAICSMVHVPLAWALAHGKLGGSPLGVVGCALSTTIVCWLGIAISAWYLHYAPQYDRYKGLNHWQPPHWPTLKKLLHLGLPMGFSVFVEMTAFTMIAFLAIPLGATAVAGHRIVASIAALVYMFPLSLGVATLVLVGQALGAREVALAHAVIKRGLFLACVIPTLIGIALWWVRDPLIRLYSDQEPVVQVALGLIPIICLYQIFDGIQTVVSHILRGYKITFLPMLLYALSFWGIGLAGGYILSHSVLGGQISGFWWGNLFATLIASGSFFFVLLRVMQKRSR